MNVTPEIAWVVLIGACTAFLTVTDVILRISVLKNRAAAPEEEQNMRIQAVEDWKNQEFSVWKKEVDRKLDNDLNRFKKVSDYNQVTGMALIAILDHCIAGNNLHQMEQAKTKLAEHLTGK